MQPRYRGGYERGSSAPIPRAFMADRRTAPYHPSRRGHRPFARPGRGEASELAHLVFHLVRVVSPNRPDVEG